MWQGEGDQLTIKPWRDEIILIEVYFWLLIYLWWKVARNWGSYLDINQIRFMWDKFFWMCSLKKQCKFLYETAFLDSEFVTDSLSHWLIADWNLPVLNTFPPSGPQSLSTLGLVISSINVFLLFLFFYTNMYFMAQSCTNVFFVVLSY